MYGCLIECMIDFKDLLEWNMNVNFRFQYDYQPLSRLCNME